MSSIFKNFSPISSKRWLAYQELAQSGSYTDNCATEKYNCTFLRLGVWFCKAAECSSPGLRFLCANRVLGWLPQILKSHRNQRSGRESLKWDGLEQFPSQQLQFPSFLSYKHLSPRPWGFTALSICGLKSHPGKLLPSVCKWNVQEAMMLLGVVDVTPPHTLQPLSVTEELLSLTPSSGSQVLYVHCHAPNLALVLPADTLAERPSPPRCAFPSLDWHPNCCAEAGNEEMISWDVEPRLLATPARALIPGGSPTRMQKDPAGLELSC